MWYEYYCCPHFIDKSQNYAVFRKMTWLADGTPAKSSQSHLTLWRPVDCSPPGSSVHGILQARMLEWIIISTSRGSSQPRDQTCVSYVSYIGRRVLYHEHPGDGRDYIERYFYLDTMLTPVILPLHSTVDNAFNYWKENEDIYKMCMVVV